MNLDIVTTEIIVIAFTILWITFIYSTNLRYVGYILLFLWNLFILPFHYTTFHPYLEFKFLLSIVGCLFLVASFFMFISIIRLHSNSTNIATTELSKFQQLALNRYRNWYSVVISMFLGFILFWNFFDYFHIQITEFVRSDSILLATSIFVFLMIWLLSEPKNLFYLYLSFSLGLGVLFLGCLYLQKDSIKTLFLLLLNNGLMIGAYLVFLSIWIYQTTSYKIL